jgi:hypothetical protein
MKPLVDSTNVWPVTDFCSKVADILDDIQFNGWVITVDSSNRQPYLQVSEPNGLCEVNGTPLPWKGRKWRLSLHMTKSEVVATAFKAVMTAVEHETREQFKYRGEAIFGPHHDVDALVDFCKAHKPDSR